MKKIILSLITLVFFSACSKKEIAIPENVLMQKEMSAILTDVHIAQSALTNVGRVDSSIYSMNDYLDYILKQHKTDKKNFLVSLKFYSDNPEMLQEVYDSVLTNLSRVEAGLEK